MKTESLVAVSIIVPTYNRADTLVETLQSIQDQTFSSWECLIIDDHSTDDTEKRLSAFLETSRFLFLPKPNKLPRGPSSSRNYGLSRARGQYVCFFDSDDVMEPEYLFDAAAVLDNHADVDAVLMGYKAFREEGKELIFVESSHPRFSFERAFEELVLKRYRVQTNCALWRKSWLETQPFVFCPDLKKGEDLELFARFFATRRPFINLSEPRFRLLHRNDGLMANFQKKDRRMFIDHIRCRRMILQTGLNNGVVTSRCREHFLDFIRHHFKKSLQRRSLRACVEVVRMWLLVVTRPTCRSK